MTPTYEVRERWYDAKDCLHDHFVGAADASDQARQIILECPLPAHMLWVSVFDRRGEMLTSGVSGEEFLADSESVFKAPSAAYAPSGGGRGLRTPP